MIVRVSPSPVWLRLLVLLTGGVLLLWLGSEDRAVVSAVLLASIFTLLLIVQFLWTRSGGACYTLRRWSLYCIMAGFSTGAGIVIASVALMFLKTAWHAHPYPDYPPSVMLAMLARLPIWVLAGTLVGMAAALAPLVHGSADQ
jgi:hypothetical protein